MFGSSSDNGKSGNSVSSDSKFGDAKPNTSVTAGDSSKAQGGNTVVGGVTTARASDMTDNAEPGVGTASGTGGSSTQVADKASMSSAASPSGESQFKLENVNFDTSSAALLTSEKAKLDVVARYALAHPELRLEVSGHADLRPTSVSTYNKKLSENRAASVRAYLIQKGVAPQRIKNMGLGFDKPLANNASNTGKAQNRRAEIKFVQ